MSQIRIVTDSESRSSPENSSHLHLPLPFSWCSLTKADIWSFGCATVELLTATRPWAKQVDIRALVKGWVSQGNPQVLEGFCIQHESIEVNASIH